MYLNAKSYIRFNTFNNKVLPKAGLKRKNELVYFYQLCASAELKCFDSRLRQYPDR